MSAGPCFRPLSDQPISRSLASPGIRSYASVHLDPETGTRSLASLLLTPQDVEFSACSRTGAAEPDIRVKIAAAGLQDRTIPVKDHFLLSDAEKATSDLEGQLRSLSAAIVAMGPQV